MRRAVRRAVGVLAVKFVSLTGLVALTGLMAAIGLQRRWRPGGIVGREAGSRGMGSAVGQVVDLQGQVGDAVVVGQESLEVGADRVAVLARLDKHVRRRGGHPGRDLPDVQVMDLSHVRAASHCRSECRWVEPCRGRLKEDPSGSADQPRTGVQHENHHDERGDRVCAGEPARQHHDGGSHGGHERVQVGEDVRDRALHVQAAPPVA